VRWLIAAGGISQRVLAQLTRLAGCSLPLLVLRPAFVGNWFGGWVGLSCPCGRAFNRVVACSRESLLPWHHAEGAQPASRQPMGRGGGTR
jgi:hypothetical protein